MGKNKETKKNQVEKYIPPPIGMQWIENKLCVKIPYTNLTSFKVMIYLFI